MSIRKVLGPALAVALLVGVGFAVYLSSKEKGLAPTAGGAAPVTVKVLTGSEKEKFLADPELTALLQAQGITLVVQKAGSREIANRPDLKDFDVAYPAGAHAAAKIAQVTGSRQVAASFYTPMAVASWKTLLPTLQKAGLVSEKDGAHILDIGKLISMMEKDVRWKDMPGNSAYAVGKSVLISSTDVRKSNSGAMYLALAAYLANGSNVVDNEADADKVAGKLVRLFSKQGFLESSSVGPFEDYTAMGIGKAPLVLVYEQQFIEHALSRPSLNPDMMLLYPAPTILSKHTMVAMSDKGTRFMQFMANDPKVASIAQRYGFRTADNTELFAALQAKSLKLPQTLVDVVDPPSFDVLEKLIGHIDVALTK